MDEIIEIFQKQQGQLAVVELLQKRAIVTIDFEGFKDGEAFEGGREPTPH